MNVLVLNCGSSTVKFQLIATDLDHIARDADEHLAGGQVERIGGEAIITFKARGGEARRTTAPVRDTRAAVEAVIRWVTSADSGIDEVRSVADIHAVGHRVVHGGERFTQSVVVTDEVLRGIEDCIDLAPLHNPGNIRGI
ncbi:MAG TPA: acetate kinase, partial [Pyrinomonadaceae bacterium]|nr:acetate kinase [Pyrinomonadaceae bacterium]